MTKAQANEVLCVLWFILCLIGELGGMPLWWTICPCIMAVWRGLRVAKEGGA